MKEPDAKLGESKSIWKAGIGISCIRREEPSSKPFALQAFTPKDRHSRPMATGRVCTDTHGVLCLSLCVSVAFACLHTMCVI